MNPIFAVLMLFSGIFLLFFGVPIAGLFLMSLFGPASTEPISLTVPAAPIMMPQPYPVGKPIFVQEVSHRGDLIWVDVTPILATD